MTSNSVCVTSHVCEFFPSSPAHTIGRTTPISSMRDKVGASAVISENLCFTLNHQHHLLLQDLMHLSCFLSFLLQTQISHVRKRDGLKILEMQREEKRREETVWRWRSKTSHSAALYFHWLKIEDKKQSAGRKKCAHAHMHIRTRAQINDTSVSKTNVF